MSARPSSRTRLSAGAVAGFVLRLTRESIPLTQTAMAEALGVDLGTVQGRESGRRPLANMKAGAFLDLKRRLLTLGADHAALGLLDAAMDADRIVDAALAPPEQPDLHPLAGWVHTRDTAHMIAWAVNGTAPPALRDRSPSRRGPVAEAPLMGAQDRTAFFTNLRDAVEAAAQAGDGQALLRRQALYLTSYDRSPEADSWAAHALHARRGITTARGGSPRWAEARSTATALSRRGDPVPLLDFIDRAMADDDAAEAANLNYWAYWMGALREPQANDHFMADRALTGWDPVTLLRDLARGFVESPGYVDLYAHSLWALLTAHPWLPRASPTLAHSLADRVARILDAGVISPRSRRELGAVHYVLRDQQH
ncbi:helix-turn-helix domain-containing protein [Streptomyces sp. NPDC090442]|uniref:helix-turn-helix domain-containing protein n=1 Tax=Streptomyces sp. NPDC090442 TaxID=3365962 RepID=UPI00381798F3